jgi:O-acetyl-ADP-ribose deacetylase (regulator of RNase III)
MGFPIRFFKLSMNARIQLLQGDITKITADAIVNAANTSLLGGGGVDDAIHRAGGPAILTECRRIRDRQGGCKVGEAVITTGGNLPARYVIHAVGPVWQDGHSGEPELLAAAYRNSLRLAAIHMIRTVAFPNISTGIYHFPKNMAAAIALDTVTEFLERSKEIEKLIFVCFDEENYELYDALMGV